MKMKKILFLLILFVIPLVYAQPPAPGGLPSIPDRFIGTIKINDADAPIGTEIIVKVDDILDDTYTTTIAGSYDIYAKIGSSGDTITFFINDVQADQTATRIGGTTFYDFDLTFSVTTTTTIHPSGGSGGSSRRRTTTTTIPQFPTFPITETEDEKGKVILIDEGKQEGIGEITGAAVGTGKIEPITIFVAMMSVIIVGSLAYFLLFRKR